VPFTPEQLSALYEDHGLFVSAWNRAIKKLVKDGFILEADEHELTQSAVHSQIGR
jgi:hypothetical protein